MHTLYQLLTFSFNLLGNPGWDYASVLPYFKKSEDMRIPQFQNEYHGVGGELTVEYFKYATPMKEAFLQAGREMGYPVRDVNGAYQTGFTQSHATIRLFFYNNI